ncbi:MAG: metallo-mystery pair system four-Cys motif protein [Polyangiaceae bacterium]
MLRRSSVVGLFVLGVSGLVGCKTETTDDGVDPPKESAFALKFSATLGGKPVSCGALVSGEGPNGKFSVGASDLRFYVSNIQFHDKDGKVVARTLDTNDFQLTDPSGEVALIDLTGNTEGSCAANAIAFAEGTARTNDVVKGKTVVENVTSVSFDIGVPQPLMKSIIGSHSLENAPTPLNEMYWNWASGYRHFVFNFVAEDDMGAKGGGYVHLGSRNCGPDDGLALSDRDACEFVNTPSVEVKDFDLATDSVVVDLDAILKTIDFSAPIYDPMTFEVIGQGVGAECHSSPMQPDCPLIFPAFGVDIGTGKADAAKNAVFGVAP